MRASTPTLLLVHALLLLQSAGHALPTDVEMIGVTAEGRAYWPRWRGPTGQGLAVDSGYPDRWSPQDNVVWRVEVPGRGHSSPIVWGDRVFLTTAYEGGRRRSLVAFSRNDGSLLWESFAPAAEPESIYAKNSHASSTPATDGRLVYAYLGNHGLTAFDMEGRRVWHRSFDDVSTRHGTAGSPLLYRDRVILFQDHDGPRGSFLAAFAREDGRQLWWTPRREHVGWGSPVAIRAGDRDEIVVSSQGRVYAYDPDDGRELWSCRGNLSEVTPTPVVGAGLVFCTSGRAGPTLAIRPGGAGDVTDTHVAWQTPKGSPFIPSPLFHDGRLYTVNDMVSVVSCYRARDGKLLWQGRLGEARRESFSASPVAVDGKVFLTNDEGQTFVVRAGDRFELLHVNELGEPVLASPALVDRNWYIRGRDHLYRIGHAQ
ncbi:MAG: PQQ-binding-like beta-propeller repeat protein [Thermoanaerobaculia bacterium]|nr:PQQ-binding-like beta-propeller repeat protein [Thermoanaerobaculia bacterium]